jgi:hypothetical protein
LERSQPRSVAKKPQLGFCNRASVTLYGGSPETPLEYDHMSEAFGRTLDRKLSQQSVDGPHSFVVGNGVPAQGVRHGAVPEPTDGPHLSTARMAFTTAGAVAAPKWLICAVLVTLLRRALHVFRIASGDDR